MAANVGRLAVYKRDGRLERHTLAHRQGHDTQGGIAKHGRDEARLGDQLQVATGLPGERRRIMA